MKLVHYIVLLNLLIHMKAFTNLHIATLMHVCVRYSRGTRALGGFQEPGRGKAEGGREEVLEGISVSLTLLGAECDDIRLSARLAAR